MEQDHIWISLPGNIHGNHGLQVFSRNNPGLVTRFEKICYERFMTPPHSDFFGTFFQGGHDSKTWRYFEFWKSSRTDVQDAILEAGTEIAHELGLELEIHDG